jgi:hypothetical protein
LQSVLQPTVVGENPGRRPQCADTRALCLVAVLALSIPAMADDKAAMAANAAITPADRNWSTTFDTEVRYTAWTATRGFPAAPITNGGSGSQVYIPLSLQFTGRPWQDVKLEFLARSGYVSAKQTTGGQTGAVTTTTDTTLTPTVTYLGWETLQPFTSVTLNLPTGKSVLYGNTRFARMDSDLVDIPTFGEGFNIGPSIGANIPFTT